MHCTTRTTYQLASIFGGNYAVEQHGDEIQRCLPRSKERAFAVDLDEMLKVLRTALSFRQ